MMTSNQKPVSAKDTIEKDARGQYAGTQSGGTNNGVASAKPRVLIGKDDATEINKEATGDRDVQDNIGQKINKDDR